jgi:hypothetical protein
LREPGFLSPTRWSGVQGIGGPRQKSVIQMATPPWINLTVIIIGSRCQAHYLAAHVLSSMGKIQGLRTAISIHVAVQIATVMVALIAQNGCMTLVGKRIAAGQDGSQQGRQCQHSKFGHLSFPGGASCPVQKQVGVIQQRLQEPGHLPYSPRKSCRLSSVGRAPDL